MKIEVTTTKTIEIPDTLGDAVRQRVCNVIGDADNCNNISCVCCPFNSTETYNLFAKEVNKDAD